MLLRAWDIVTFSDFGAAWESADGGGLLITEGIRIHIHMHIYTYTYTYIYIYIYTGGLLITEGMMKA